MTSTWEYLCVISCSFFVPDEGENLKAYVVCIVL